LAVVCRLTGAYRATSDLDIVSRCGAHDRPQLELLLASGAEASGPTGALVPTSVGDVQVDVLEVTDAEVADLPDDPTDRLHVLSHAWAAASATPMIIRAGEMSNLTVAVAEPGPLVAMKLQSIMNRPAVKEGGHHPDRPRPGDRCRSACPTANRGTPAPSGRRSARSALVHRSGRSIRASGTRDTRRPRPGSRRHRSGGRTTDQHPGHCRPGRMTAPTARTFVPGLDSPHQRARSSTLTRPDHWGGARGPVDP
jgi:hypothetical protein